MIKLTNEVKLSMGKSVLCWLATVSVDGQPNTSPKEVFTYYDDHIIIANIASPRSAANIKQHNQVCVSFVDILEQRGFKIYGTATLLHHTHGEFAARAKCLQQITQGLYPFTTIIDVDVTAISKIVAPSYFLFPEQSVADKVHAARKRYKL